MAYTVLATAAVLPFVGRALGYALSARPLRVDETLRAPKAPQWAASVSVDGQRASWSRACSEQQGPRRRDVCASTAQPAYSTRLSGMDLTTELSLPEVRAASMTGLVVLEWRLTPTADSAKRLAPVLSRLIRASTTPIMLLTIAQGSSAPPNSETREMLIREINALGKGLGGVALSLEGSGFGVAAVRAIVSSIYIVTRPPYAVKVYSTVSESVAWLLGQWPRDATKVTQREFEDAISRFRAG